MEKAKILAKILGNGGIITIVGLVLFIVLMVLGRMPVVEGGLFFVAALAAAKLL